MRTGNKSFSLTDNTQLSLTSTRVRRTRRPFAYGDFRKVSLERLHLSVQFHFTSVQFLCNSIDEKTNLYWLTSELTDLHEKPRCM